MTLSPSTFLPLLLAASLTVAGCATTSGGGGSNGGGDMNNLVASNHLPPGAKINHAQSLIMGSGDNWIGRILMDLDQSNNAAYGYFLEQYPQQGWSLVSAVRGKTSLLVFTKADRSATIELTEGGVLGGSQAALTVSPRSTLPATPAAGTSSPTRR